MKLISRQDARAAGLKKYYTGATCRYGHDAERYVSTGNCVKCTARDLLLAHTQISVPRFLEVYFEAFTEAARRVTPDLLVRLEDDEKFNLWIDGLWVGRWGTKGELEIYKWQWLISEAQKRDRLV